MFHIRGRYARPLGVAVALLMTAACAGTDNLERGPHRDPMITQALLSLSQPKPRVPLEPTPGLQADGGLDGGLLNGLTGAAITAILGMPNRVRHDFPAQVWLYNRPRCFVDVFLYDEEGRGPRTVYVQERSRHVKKVRPGACLGEVWKVHQNGDLRSRKPQNR